MGKSFRYERLATEIEKVIANMLINGVKDPRLVSNFVNVTGVEVTSDGSYATVYVTVLGFTEDADEVERKNEEVLSGLASAKGLFKKELAHSVSVRRLPELIFKIDSAQSYGKHIDDILKTLPIESYHAEDHSKVKEDEE